ncbi:hypothetical protein ACTQ54_02565 [Fundicoccus sp. Sow4_H7]|uniref:hypothetical protein n=1 Tax=Fundicoccus sp. Sow4_H7 TaxID=3438784 RepID=UPI003F8FF72E
MNFHQTDKNFTHVSPEDYSVYIENVRPTRIVQQIGWRFSPSSNKYFHYFDTGQVATAPFNYLLVKFWDTMIHSKLRSNQLHKLHI